MYRYETDSTLSPADRVSHQTVGIVPRRALELGQASGNGVDSSGATLVISGTSVARRAADFGEPTLPSQHLAAPDTSHVTNALAAPDQGALTANSVAATASVASELANAVDPNPTGLLATFGHSANGVAAPLGPQVSYADVTPTASKSASGGGGGLMFVLLAALGIGGYFYFKNQHHHGGDK